MAVSGGCVRTASVSADHNDDGFGAGSVPPVDPVPDAVEPIAEPVPITQSEIQPDLDPTVAVEDPLVEPNEPLPVPQVTPLEPDGADALADIDEAILDG